MTRLFCNFIALCLFLPHTANADSAEIMLLPVRVVLENKDRYAAVIVKNVGDAVGDYTVDLVDMKMLETGAVVPLAAGDSPQYSAIPYLHIAPRSMTLKPSETQYVRLTLRKPEGLEPGEYRAHLRLRMINSNAAEAVKTAGKDAVISVKPKLAIVIPVIVRNGATSLAMGIEQPRLMHDATGKPAIDMSLTRNGNRSVIGDISVTYIPQGGAPQVIKVFRGVSVYRPVTRRFLSVPLDEMPKGITLAHGKLDIVYSAQKKDGGKVLAETQVNLQ